MKRLLGVLVVLLLFAIALVLIGASPPGELSWCGLLNFFRFEQGLMIVLPIIGGLIYNYLWELVPGFRDWFEGQSVKLKQLAVAVGALALMVAGTFAAQATCGVVIENWLDEGVRILQMTGVYFGFATLGHQLDVQYRQRR